MESHPRSGMSDTDDVMQMITSVMSSSSVSLSGPAPSFSTIVHNNHTSTPPAPFAKPGESGSGTAPPLQGAMHWCLSALEMRSEIEKKNIEEGRVLLRCGNGASSTESSKAVAPRDKKKKTVVYPYHDSHPISPSPPLTPKGAEENPSSVPCSFDTAPLRPDSADVTPIPLPSWQPWCHSLGLDADQVTYEMLCTTGVSPLFEVKHSRTAAGGSKREREGEAEDGSPERKLVTLEELERQGSRIRVSNPSSTTQETSTTTTECRDVEKSLDVDVEVDITDDVRLCNLVTVLPRRFPLERLMQQIVPTVSYDLRGGTTEIKDNIPETISTTTSEEHSGSGEEGKGPQTHVLSLLRAAQRQHLFSHICPPSQKHRLRYLLTSSSEIAPYQLYEQRIENFLHSVSPEERKRIASDIFFVLQKKDSNEIQVQESRVPLPFLQGSRSSAPTSVDTAAISILLQAVSRGLSQAAQEWDCHATLWKSLLSTALAPNSTPSSLTPPTVPQPLSFQTLIEGHLQDVLGRFWSTFQEEERVWNTRREHAHNGSTPPKAPDFVATPSFALVEWVNGDVDVTSDVDGLAREQRIRMERTYYLPPTTTCSLESSPQNTHDNSYFRLGKPSTVLEETVVEQIQRLRNYYRERQGYLHKEKILEETCRQPLGAAPTTVLTHPCGCIRCGRWFPRFAQWQHHRSSVDDHVLQYMDYLLTSSTRPLSKKMGSSRAFRWMTKRPSSGANEAHADVGDVDPGLFFPYMCKRRGQIEQEVQQRHSGQVLDGATNVTKKDSDFSSILKRLRAFLTMLPEGRTASASVSMSHFNPTLQHGALLSDLLYGSDTMRTAAGEVEEEMNSEIACFHDSVLDELVLIGLERRNPHVPYHTILCPPSEALMHLVAEKLEEVLLLYRSRCIISTGERKVSFSFFRIAFSTEQHFFKFCDVMMYTVEIFFFRHYGGLRPRQREILLEMCARVCDPSVSHYYSHSVKTGADGDYSKVFKPGNVHSSTASDNSESVSNVGDESFYPLYSAIALFHLTAIVQRSAGDLTSLCLAAATRILHQRTFIMYDLIRSAYPFSSPSASNLSPNTGMEAPLVNAVGAVTPQQYQRYAEWFTRNPSPGGILQVLSRSSLWSQAIRDRFSVWLGGHAEGSTIGRTKKDKLETGEGQDSGSAREADGFASMDDSNEVRGSDLSLCDLFTEFALLTPDFFPRLAHWLEGRTHPTSTSVPSSSSSSGPSSDTSSASAVQKSFQGAQGNGHLGRGNLPDAMNAPGSRAVFDHSSSDPVGLSTAHPSTSLPQARSLPVKEVLTNTSVWDDEAEVHVGASALSAGATPPFYQLYPCEEVPTYQVPPRLVAQPSLNGNNTTNSGENGPRAAFSTVVEVLQHTGRTMTWWELDAFVTHLKETSTSSSSSSHHYVHSPISSPTGGNVVKSNKPSSNKKRSHESIATNSIVNTPPSGESAQISNSSLSQTSPPPVEPKRRGRPPKVRKE